MNLISLAFVHVPNVTTKGRHADLQESGRKVLKKSATKGSSDSVWARMGLLAMRADIARSASVVEVFVEGTIIVVFCTKNYFTDEFINRDYLII